MAIRTEIEIAAAPDVVRKNVVEFAQIPTWHSGFFKSIKPHDSGATAASEGTRLHCETTVATFDCTVITASPSQLAWRGDQGFIYGVHTFEFNPSTSTPGGTTFVQSEEYMGYGKFLLAAFLLGGKIKKDFEQFNADLKKKCEGIPA